MRILNYKAFYEAFKNGVVDKKAVSVARLLFKPLFEPCTLVDENGTPYGISPQNASPWTNGTKLIPAAIQEAVVKEEWRNKIYDYFNSELIDSIPDSLMDEMLDEVLELVKNCDLNDRPRKNIIKDYDDNNIGDFLAETFIRSLLGDNKKTFAEKNISASDENSPATNQFNRIVFGKPTPLEPPQEISVDEIPYVSELYKVYSGETGKNVNSTVDIEGTYYIEHLQRQRKNYYLAETIQREIRDTMHADEDGRGFKTLKAEIDEGINTAVHRQYRSGMEKVDTVLEKAGEVQISPNLGDFMYGWVGPGEKKGVCHMLVNDEKIHWVEDEHDGTI